MATSNLLTEPESRNHLPRTRRPRRESLEGLPWPRAWEKHRRAAEAQEEADAAFAELVDDLAAHAVPITQSAICQELDRQAAEHPPATACTA